MTYVVDSGRAQPWPACTLENRVSPACGPSAQGIRAGGDTPSGADILSVCPGGQTQWPSSLTAGARMRHAGGMGTARRQQNTAPRMAPALIIDQFGPVYLAPMPGGPAADRVSCFVSSLNCAAGAPCAGGGFLGGVP